MSAVARPKATFDGLDMYPDLFTKTAALFESLVGNHPFVDGNYRTAITSAGLFLKMNRVRLVASQKELETFVLLAAQGKFSFEERAAWFRAYSINE
jgi:death on curing protein